jgi:hypothetical protein
VRTLLATLALTTLLLAGASSASEALAAPASKRCVSVKVGKRSVCVRVGSSCSAANRSAYLAKGLDCVLRRGRRVIAKASPAAIRQGRYIALPASGTPTREQAFAAFDATVADLPGVSAPAGTVGGSQSGTTALRWMNEHFYELTTAQQRAVTAAMGGAQPAFTLPIDENGNIVDPNAPVPAPEPAPAPEAPPAAAAGVRARAAQAEAFLQIAREAVPIMAARGVRVRHPVTVTFLTQDRGTTLAEALPSFLCAGAGTTVGVCAGADLAPTSCSIRIYPAIQNAALAVRREVLLHELTHCAQFEAMGSLGDLGAVPQWVMDGTADYVAQTLSQAWSGSVPLASWWPTWLRSPERNLFTRGYDAVGFWHLLAQKGIDVYALVDPVTRAGVGGSSSAYSRAIQGVQALAEDWGPTSVSLRSNPAWKLNFPWVPTPDITTRPVTKDSSFEGNFDRLGAYVSGLRLAADLVIVSTNASTTGRLLDSSNTGYPISGTQTFCTRPGGCACPEEEPDTTPKIRAGQAYLGLADVSGAGYFTVRGQSLEEHCKRKRPGGNAPSGPAPGTSGGGLEIRDLNTALMGRISSGTCSVRGGTFVATGSGGGYRFLMRIQGATRPGSYVIPIGSGSTFVQISGAAGLTSNRPVQGFPGGGSADLARVRVRRNGRTVTRWRISVGVTPLFSTASSQPAAAIIPAAGGLIC